MSNVNIVELVDKAITSPNFNRGKVFKAMAERLEAANITVTKEIKRQLYAAIDTKIKSLLPIGKQWTVTTSAVGHKLTTDGKLQKTGRISTLDTITVMPIIEELAVLKAQYVATALKAIKQPDSISLPKQLRRVRNAIVIRIFSIRISLVKEDITVADDYDKWLTALEKKQPTKEVVPVPTPAS